MNWLKRLLGLAPKKPTPYGEGRKAAMARIEKDGVTYAENLLKLMEAASISGPYIDGYRDVVERARAGADYIRRARP